MPRPSRFQSRLRPRMEGSSGEMSVSVPSSAYRTGRRWVPGPHYREMWAWDALRPGQSSARKCVSRRAKEWETRPRTVPRCFLHSSASNPSSTLFLNGEDRARSNRVRRARIPGHDDGRLYKNSECTQPRALQITSANGLTHVPL